MLNDQLRTVARQYLLDHCQERRQQVTRPGIFGHHRVKCPRLEVGSNLQRCLPRLDRRGGYPLESPVWAGIELGGSERQEIGLTWTDDGLGQLVSRTARRRLAQ